MPITHAPCERERAVEGASAAGELVVIVIPGLELRWTEQPIKSRTPTRFLSTTAATKTAHDDSTIDTVNTPSVTPKAPPLPEVVRPPLLPDNDSPPPGTAVSDKEAAIEPVIRPEITTVCADGTHIDTPSAMSEVTDNDAAELDPYDLASKVTAAAAKSTDVATKKMEEPGSARALWNGLLDDLFGEKKVSKT